MPHTQTRGGLDAPKLATANGVLRAEIYPIALSQWRLWLVSLLLELLAKVAPLLKNDVLALERLVLRLLASN